MNTQYLSRNTTGSIEFVVIPQEDLFLEGEKRKLYRVGKGIPYPCQMQKNQNFGCLFRHYAKHNGLQKEDLVFYFTSELSPEDTPESVHLMPLDEIWVSYVTKIKLLLISYYFYIVRCNIVNQQIKK